MRYIILSALALALVAALAIYAYWRRRRDARLPDLLDGVIGYVNMRGQLYASRETLETNLPDEPLEPLGLFLLFANTQFVEHGSGHWIHSHGMEQFGLPDIEIRATQGGQARHYWGLVTGAAVYMIERGPILKPGDTTELGGNGVIYRIQQARSEYGDTPRQLKLRGFFCQRSEQCANP